MTTARTRRLAAVWFADIAGYTELSARDENAALAVVDELQRLAGEAVGSRGGRIVKFVGDAVLTVFDSTDSALKAALALQDSFAASEIVQQNESALRVGMHVGEVAEAEDGDVYGDGVNFASRIEGQAEAGQVVVSEPVHGMMKQQADYDFSPFGPVTLKGVAEPMWLYVVGECGTLTLDQRDALLATYWHSHHKARIAYRRFVASSDKHGKVWLQHVKGDLFEPDVLQPLVSRHLIRVFEEDSAWLVENTAANQGWRVTLTDEGLDTVTKLVSASQLRMLQTHSRPPKDLFHYGYFRPSDIRAYRDGVEVELEDAVLWPRPDHYWEEKRLASLRIKRDS